MKFGRYIVEPLGLQETWNGISTMAPEISKISEYDEGSYIKQVNNVLFLTVDVFRIDDLDKMLHLSHGAVTADISGSIDDISTHLGWIEAILAAADQDPSVDHVIVQGHTPVLAGVRKTYSSGMMMDARQDSPFWQVLRAHSQNNGGKVRFYFAGEVHAPTATIDSETDIVQLVHGNPPLGGGGSNYIVFDVSETDIYARIYQVDLTSKDGEQYWVVSEGFLDGTSGLVRSTLSGTLSIDISAKKTEFSSSGLIKLNSHLGLLLHYQLDTSEDQLNAGGLGDFLYSVATYGNPESVQGKFGLALHFNGDGDYLKSRNGWAPVIEGEQRTASAWVKTSSTQYDTVFAYGRPRDPKAGEFNFRLANGAAHLHVKESTIAWADNPPINDNEWHHMAVSLPNKHNNKLSEVVFYVDGVKYTSRIQTPSKQDLAIFTEPYKSDIYIATDANNLAGNNNVNHFNGALDDIAFWAGSLTDGKLKAIFQMGIHSELNYNAKTMDSLFELYNVMTGYIDINQRRWTYASGLEGNSGELLELENNQFAIVLDDRGNGLINDRLKGY